MNICSPGFFQDWKSFFDLAGTFCYFKHILKKGEGVMIHKLVLAAVIIMKCFAVSVYANASSVEITVPDNVKKGSTIIIHLKIIHNANNIFHYTDWAWIKINGKELARWDFTWNHRPEKEIFYRDVTYTMRGPVVVTAKSNCNLHGSAGEQSTNIQVK
jgi:desulfoferrodoxin (superoxide reductase-like protein)